MKNDGFKKKQQHMAWKLIEIAIILLLLSFLFWWFPKRTNMSHCMIYLRFELGNPSVHVGGATVGLIIIHKKEPSAHVFAVGTHPDV
jgi:hypothetical protein